MLDVVLMQGHKIPKSITSLELVIISEFITEKNDKDSLMSGVWNKS